MSTRWRATLSLVALAVSCGGPQELGGSGTKCFRDDDCKSGLICVAPTAADARRVCSNDPTPIISMVEMPEIATGGSAGAATAGASAGGKAAGGGAGATSGGAPPSAGSGGNPTSGSSAGGSEGGGSETGGTSAGTATGGSDSGGTDTGGTDAAGGAPP